METNKLYAINTHKFAVELPKIVERKGKDWVDYGAHNLYPQLLIDLYNTSSMHHSAVQAVVDAIVGNGIIQWGDTIVNSHGQTLNEVFDLVALDYKLYGGFSMNTIWSNSGETLAEIYHLPFNNVRSGLMNEDEKVEEYWYCSDWKNYRKAGHRSYPAFSMTDNQGDRASQIFYYYDYAPGQTYYPLPDYVAANNDIDIDARVSRFHSSNLKNGLAPSMLLAFRNGLPPKDEQDEIWRDINATFAGEENAGTAFIVFSEPGREPVLTPIQNSNDGYYITLEERISSRILTAHRITSPLLLGIKDSNGFSSQAEEIQTAYQHFLGTVIIPKQKILLKQFNKIFKMMGYNVELKIEQSQILPTFEQKIEISEQNNPQ